MRKEPKKTLYVERARVESDEYRVIKAVNTLTPKVNTFIKEKPLQELIDLGVEVVITPIKR